MRSYRRSVTGPGRWASRCVPGRSRPSASDGLPPYPRRFECATIEVVCPGGSKFSLGTSDLVARVVDEAPGAVDTGSRPFSKSAGDPLGGRTTRRSTKPQVRPHRRTDTACQTQHAPGQSLGHDVSLTQSEAARQPVAHAGHVAAKNQRVQPRHGPTPETPPGPTRPAPQPRGA